MRGMQINGKVSEIKLPMTVKELVRSMGYREDRVAVELNGKIVPKCDYENVHLTDDDSVEVVGFVGGG